MTFCAICSRSLKFIFLMFKAKYYDEDNPYDDIKTLMDNVLAGTALFTYANSSLNPLLYAFLSK